MKARIEAPMPDQLNPVLVLQILGKGTLLTKSPGQLTSGRTLDFESGYGRSNRSPAANFEDDQKEESYERALLRIRGVVKATVTSLGKKQTVSPGSLLKVARSSNWLG